MVEVPRVPPPPMAKSPPLQVYDGTGLHSSVTFATLVLLQQLKVRFHRVIV